MPKRTVPSLTLEAAFWRDGYVAVAGLDEVGVGALAGPVVAAAVLLPPLDKVRGWYRRPPYAAIATAADSKALTPRRRHQLFDPICALARAYAIGIATPAEIDELNILRAARLAMRRALDALSISPDALLLDACVLPDVPLPQQGIIRGDSLVLSIAAASIIAKVTRDRMMGDLAQIYPQYGFERHKGYGTAVHLAALRRYGPSPIHRQSFAPVRDSEKTIRQD